MIEVNENQFHFVLHRLLFIIGFVTDKDLRDMLHELREDMLECIECEE